MDLEQALLASFMPGANQQNALNFLFECTQNPSFFQPSVDFFFKTNNEKVRELVTSIILSMVDRLWSNIDPQVCANFRSQIVQFFFTNDISPNISSQLEIIIASIAFNDWPEVWPSFIDEIVNIINDGNSNNISPLVINGLPKFFHILTNLVTRFSTSQYITVMRRNLLVLELQFKVVEIINYLQSISCEQVLGTEIGLSFIMFMEYFCQLNFEDQQICLNIANFLFSNFASAYPLTFKALDHLIVRKPIDLSLFHLSIQAILNLMQKQIADPTNLIEFICHLVKIALPIFPQCCTDSSFFGAMRCILEFTITNSPKNDYHEEIWDLWAELLHHFADGMQLRTSALYLILEPILPSTLAGLFELLPLAMLQSRLRSFHTISAIIAYSIIDDNLLISFLAQKPLSSALLIALGIINCLHDNELFDAIMNNVIPQVLTNYNIDINSSLFVLSRNSEYLRNHPEVLKEFLNIISNLLVNAENNEIKQSALFALNHIASKIPESIYDHCQEFIIFMIQNFIDPTKLERCDFLRTCRILSKIVASVRSKDDQMKLAEMLTTPISVLLTGNTTEMIQIGCLAASNFAYIPALSCEPTMQFLWPPLSIALNNTKNNELFYDVCECFSTTIRTVPWKRCFQVVSSFVTFIQTVANQECAIVHACSQIRLCHREMDEFRAIILENFITKLSQQNVTAEFLEFFEAFDIIDNTEEGLVLPIACQAIRCFDLNITKISLKILLVHYRAKQVPFMLSCDHEIIIAIFDALFDQMHHKVIKKLLSLLYHVVDKMHKRQIPFEQSIFGAIKEKVCDDGLSQKFVISLKNSITSESMFTELAGNLLIAAGRANPSEIQMLSDTCDTRAKTVTFLSRGIFQNEDEIAK
ncbi:hypothetical protein TRFO_10812 [Tritrichomonas foetus]|uniref:Exportin-1/Importin-beta-like domain-containing protein n=1 Tax=Tritrichomonas foetus TaxID=1144522 RepID=A0A1J4J6R2_9EUKA|nr:hypothetical protein TRFO_10812 [Tritrichomonas foetus]|eukprot:OHS94880.1 hypothetical protein TRFO_10812 [Tritrichomonas foetus]